MACMWVLLAAWLLGGWAAGVGMQGPGKAGLGQASRHPNHSTPVGGLNPTARTGETTGGGPGKGPVELRPAAGRHGGARERSQQEGRRDAGGAVALPLPLALAPVAFVERLLLGH